MKTSLVVASLLLFVGGCADASFEVASVSDPQQEVGDDTLGVHPDTGSDTGAETSTDADESGTDSGSPSDTGTVETSPVVDSGAPDIKHDTAPPDTGVVDTGTVDTGTPTTTCKFCTVGSCKTDNEDESCHTSCAISGFTTCAWDSTKSPSCHCM